VTAVFLKRLALFCALVVGSVEAFAAMSGTARGAVRKAMNQGRADDALRLLDTALQADPNDADALNLRCRVFYAEERWDDAIGACERAVQLAPNNSNYHLWLGRAYGEKAERVNFVTAYKLAKLIRVEFETAASLGPMNGEALSDLGEYYAKAPAVLGGGSAKAEEVVRQLDGFAPVRAVDLRARIAEEKKDYLDAEKEFRAKISVSHSDAQAWMDLGSFYRRRERWDEMLAAVESGAVVANVDHGPPLVDGASTLMKAGREPRMAIDWMRSYLGSNSLSEDAPAFVVHAQIGILLKQLGDKQGAQREFAAARALAKDYAGIPGENAGH
jgi:tetratricopeptide (TPR) repeat protein